jgi:hypothetical protein
MKNYRFDICPHLNAMKDLSYSQGLPYHRKTDKIYSCECDLLSEGKTCKYSGKCIVAVNNETGKLINRNFNRQNRPLIDIL